MQQVPYRQVRAVYTDSTITVYQAYPAAIAVPAAERGRFPSSYNRDRMTWIKPSFHWMMYRSGWASKPGQEHVLAIRLDRDGFAWALRHAALSHYDESVHPDREAWLASRDLPVRIQWDPERDVRLHALPYRSLQVGLSGEAVHRHVDKWITGIDDVTDLARSVGRLVADGRTAEGAQRAPAERAYPLEADIEALIGATPTAAVPTDPTGSSHRS